MLEQIDANHPSFIQGNFLKPGYKGTEYQILVLITKLLQSLNQNNNTLALMEVANLGILDDCVLAIYPDETQYDPSQAISVEAYQIKHFKDKINKAKLQAGGDIGIDKLFLGYLALTNQYRNANIIPALYTNTEMDETLATELSADGKYNIIRKISVNKCIAGIKTDVTKIPYEVFSKDEVLGNSNDFNQAALARLLCMLTRWEGQVCTKSHEPEKSANFLAIEGDILNFTPHSKQKKIPFNEKKGITIPKEDLKIYGIKEPEVERLNEIYNARNNGMPKIIDFKRRVCVDNINNFDPETWKSVKKYYNKHIKKYNAILNAEEFVVRIKTIFGVYARANRNIEEALTVFRSKQGKMQRKEAQQFLKQFRIYSQQNSYEKLYEEGVKLLAQFRRTIGVHYPDVPNNDAIAFAYMFNEVRRWFTTNYASNIAPTLNKNLIIKWLNNIATNDIFWKQCGASQELVYQIYDKINEISLIREDLNHELTSVIQKESVHVILLLGEAGVGKSVVSKRFWLNWQGSKFFLDLNQGNVNERRDELQSCLEKIPPSLIIIDRAERIVEPVTWHHFINKCREFSHFLMVVSRIELGELNLKPCHLIRVPVLTEKQIDSLKLPEFVLSSNLRALCKLPFFCQLAFKLEQTELRGNTREYFVERAIQGTYITEERYTQRMLAWLALTLAILRKGKGHQSVRIKKNIYQMPGFKALIEQDIIVHGQNNTFQFMHDIFFEIGLLRLLDRALEESYIKGNFKRLGKRLAMCLNRLSFYDFSLLLTWLRAHVDAIKQLKSEQPAVLKKAGLNKDESKLLLILLSNEEIPEPYLLKIQTQRQQCLRLFQNLEISFLELSLLFQNYLSFLKLSIIRQQNTISVLYHSLEILRERWNVPKKPEEKKLLVEVLNWINIRLNEIIGVDSSYYFKQSLSDEIATWSWFTLQFAVELISQYTELSWLKGQLPFKIDDLALPPQMVLDHCFKYLNDNLEKLFNKRSLDKTSAYNLVKYLLTILSINKNLNKSYNINQISKKKLANYLIEMEYVNSVREALKVIDHTGLKAHDFQYLVPFDPDDDLKLLTENTEHINVLSKQYLLENWWKFVNSCSEMTEIIRSMIDDDIEIIETLSRRRGLKEARSFIDIFDEPSQQIIFEHFKADLRFDPELRSNRDMLFNEWDFVAKLSLNYIKINFRKIQRTLLNDHQECFEKLCQLLGCNSKETTSNSFYSLSGRNSPTFFSSGTSRASDESLSEESTDTSSEDRESLREYYMNHYPD